MIYFCPKVQESMAYDKLCRVCVSGDLFDGITVDNDHVNDEQKGYGTDKFMGCQALVVP